MKPVRNMKGTYSLLPKIVMECPWCDGVIPVDYFAGDSSQLCPNCHEAIRLEKGHVIPEEYPELDEAMEQARAKEQS